jgi:TRAP-type C4-dicarboxylate transport system permease small subunit
MSEQQATEAATTVDADDPRARISDYEGARTRLDLWVNKSARAAAWLVSLAMAISVYEVFMRYALDSPTSWVHESTVFLISVLFALGGPAALARDRHIRVRLLYDAAGPRLYYWLRLFNDLATLVFTLVMSYAAYVMFWNASHNPMGEWDLERSGTSWNPPFPALTKAVILIALTVMFCQALLHLWQTLRGRAPLHETVE